MLISIWNKIPSLKSISMPLFLMRPTTENYETLKIVEINPQEKILDPRNTHEKKTGIMKYPRETFETDEISTRKNFGPTKYPRRHDETMALDPQGPRLHATLEI